MRNLLLKSLILSATLLNLLSAKAQDNVGIGTNSPDVNAILELSSTTKGILIPRLTAIQRTAMTPSLSNTQKGLLVFDNTDNVFYFWDGTAWTQIGAGSTTTCLTLDGAYNCGGNGVGRTINANYGAFEVTGATAATSIIKSTHTNSGVAVNASSTLASNAYSTIQSTTASTNNLVSAILGNSSAAGYGVSGQIASTGTAQAAVYGNNLRTNGGHGVWGFGFNGVVGETNNSPAFGIYGSNYGTTDPAIGTAGIGVTGIAGQSTNLALSYGVFSFDDAGITNVLDVGGNFTAGGTKSFRIQHPLKKDMFLKHFCLESPEVLNVYRGNVVLDENGEAIVILPEYFKSININFSYNLTSIGVANPDIHIKDEVNENSFSIAGGKPDSKVSWTIYAERNDKYIQDHPESKQTEVKISERDKKLLKGEKMLQIESKGNQPILKVIEN